MTLKFNKNSKFKPVSGKSFKYAWDVQQNQKCVNCGMSWKEHSVHTEKHPAGLCPYNPLKELG
jgi:hypothetical protein